MQKRKHGLLSAKSFVSRRIYPFDLLNQIRWSDGRFHWKKRQRSLVSLFLPLGIGLCLMMLLIPHTSALASPFTGWSDLRLDKRAEVGHLAHYEGKVAGVTSAHPAEIELIARNVEHGQTVFRSRVQTKDGHFRFAVQFFDGAPHQVLLLAYRSGEAKPFATQQVQVDVKTLSPPRSVQAKAFTLLMGVTTVGMMVGAGLAFWRERRKQNKQICEKKEVTVGT
jgi:hypothetical protein